MATTYRIKITKIVDGEEVKTELDKEAKGVSMLFDNVDGDSCGEVVIHDNLLSLAAKIDCSTHFKAAAKLTMLVGEMKRDRASDIEDMLSDLIGGMEQ